MQSAIAKPSVSSETDYFQGLFLFLVVYMCVYIHVHVVHTHVYRGQKHQMPWTELQNVIGN